MEQSTLLTPTTPLAGPDHAGLVVEGLTVHYGGTTAVDHVSLEVRPGEIVALLGANAAGKSSLLGAVSGIVDVESGRVRAGGRDLTRLTVEDRAKHVAHVPEGRRLFPAHTVRENLLLAGYGLGRAERRDRLERVLETFPALGDLKDREAGNLSGGEQQMVALGRGLMSDARILLIDELSLGLAPIIANSFAQTLDGLRDEGYAILLVEQYVGLALGTADRALVFTRGRVALEGSASELRERGEEMQEAYLGASDPSVAPGSAAPTGGDDAAEGGWTTESASVEPTAPTTEEHREALLPLLVGAVLTAASFIMPWYRYESFLDGGGTLLPWALDPSWLLLPLSTIGVVGIAAGQWFGWLSGRLRSRAWWAIAVLSLVAAIVVLLRTWAFDRGLPIVPGRVYERSWGLFVALNGAPMMLMVAVQVLRHDLRRRKSPR